MIKLSQIEICQKECNMSEISSTELLNDSDIPFLIDINIFDNLPQSFQDEILKNYVRIF